MLKSRFLLEESTTIVYSRKISSSDTHFSISDVQYVYEQRRTKCYREIKHLVLSATRCLYL